MNASTHIRIEEELSNLKKNLENFCQQNTLLKYRLSEIVDNNEDNSFLQMAEYFQNILLQKDETLKRLMKKLQKISQQKGLANHENTNKLQEEIKNFGEKYLKFSKEFNEKMVQNS